jgi:hypothetical protein
VGDGTTEREEQGESISGLTWVCGWRCGDWATMVKKWRWRRPVRAALGRGEKRRRMGRGTVEDSEAGTVLTQAREVVRWPGNDGKAAVAEELSGGGA